MRTLDVLLIVGGAALAALGTLRLTHAALRDMPRSIAIAIVVVGAGVVSFGAALPRLIRPAQSDISLQRELPDSTPQPGPVADLRGVVRTLDHAPVDGAKVLLTQAGSKTTTVRTASDGSFTFSRIAIGGPYRVAVTHAGGVFDKVIFVPSPSLEITVAPTTTKPDAVHVSAASLAVVGDAKGVQAVYALTLQNAARTAYTGGVPLPILPGAAALEPRSGLERSQLAFQDGTLFSAAPVMPGDTAITYTFVAPMAGKGLDLRIDTTFPTSRFDLLVGGRLRGAAHGHEDGDVRLGGRTYRRLTWRALRAGDEIAARVAPSSVPGVVRTGAIALGGVAAAVIVALPLLRRRRRGGAPVAVAPVTVQR